MYKVLLDGVHPFAAKFIELRQSASVQNAFMREAGLLWQLRHQSVVALTGVAVSEQGEGYLLMVRWAQPLFSPRHLSLQSVKLGRSAWHRLQGTCTKEQGHRGSQDCLCLVCQRREKRLGW